MEPHTILHIGLEYGGRKRNTRVRFLRQTAEDTHVIINVVNVVDASDDNALSGCSRHTCNH